MRVLSFDVKYKRFHVWSRVATDLGLQCISKSAGIAEKHEIFNGNNAPVISRISLGRAAGRAKTLAKSYLHFSGLYCYLLDRVRSFDAPFFVSLPLAFTGQIAGMSRDARQKICLVYALQPDFRVSPPFVVRLYVSVSFGRHERSSRDTARFRLEKKRRALLGCEFSARQGRRRGSSGNWRIGQAGGRINWIRVKWVTH